MPANVVKTAEDERLWNKAKAIAAKEGRAGDYAYIMGIYKKMQGGSLSKALIPDYVRLMKTPGQLPGVNTELRRSLTEMPKQPTRAELLADTRPVMRIERITDGLGLSSSAEMAWQTYLRNIISADVDPFYIRIAVQEKARADGLEGVLISALTQRALAYQKSLMRKSYCDIVTPEELLEKAEARGGRYHKRVARKSGKGYTYYYDEDSYKRSKNAHVDGQSAQLDYVGKGIAQLVGSCGKKGCGFDALKPLAEKHGVDVVNQALKKAVKDKQFKYKNKRFYASNPESGKAKAKK